MGLKHLKHYREGKDFEREYDERYMGKIGKIVELKPEAEGYSLWRKNKTKKSKGRSTSSRTVVFLSDMHVGNVFAVRSPDAQIDGNIELKMTPFAEEMYNNWGMVRDSIENKIDVLCLNGEPIDGGNKRTAGSNVWTTSIQKQLDDAERLLKMYKWQEIVMTRGSRYHVAVDNMFHEEYLAKELGVVPYSGLFGKAMEKNNDSKKYENASQYTDFYLWFVLGDKRFSVCHHVGYNKTELYRTTAIGREAAVMKFAEGKWYPKGENVDVIVRSHVHYYCQVRYRNSIALTTPCWKLPDEYLFRHGLGGTAVDIGAIEITVEPNGHIDVLEHIVSPETYPKPYEINFDKILK